MGRALSKDNAGSAFSVVCNKDILSLFHDSKDAFHAVALVVVFCDALGHVADGVGAKFGVKTMSPLFKVNTSEFKPERKRQPSRPKKAVGLAPSGVRGKSSVCGVKVGKESLDRGGGVGVDIGGRGFKKDTEHAYAHRMSFFVVADVETGVDRMGDASGRGDEIFVHELFFQV